MPGTPLLKHTWKTSVTNDAGTAIAAGSAVLLGGAEFNEKVTVGAGLTAELDCGAIDKTKVISVVISSTKDVTVDTNASDGAGGQVIALKAGQAWAWNNTMASANPITTNVTKIFVTNPNSADASFLAAFLLDLVV